MQIAGAQETVIEIKEVARSNSKCHGHEVCFGRSEDLGLSLESGPLSCFFSSSTSSSSSFSLNHHFFFFFKFVKENTVLFLQGYYRSFNIEQTGYGIKSCENGELSNKDKLWWNITEPLVCFKSYFTPNLCC